MQNLPVAALTAENTRLRQEVAELRATLNRAEAGIFQAAEPSGRRMLVALNGWCDIAEDPTHAGREHARALLRTYAQVHKRALAGASNIVVANGPAGGAGR